MTSRNPAGLQRSMSGTASRPVSSQPQYLSPAAATRKNDNNFVDLTFDSNDSSAHSRSAGTSRAGGSRLKMEETMESPSSMEYDQEPLPRGRPALQSFFSGDEIAWEGSSNAQSLMSTPGMEKPSRIMPMPQRVGQHAKPPARVRPVVLQTATLKKDARPKPYHLEIPLIAPRYPPNGHLEFFPWTGNHPEDQFTDSIIRQGYFDRAPPTLEKEKESAKPIVWNGMKHKSGPQSLSGLFAKILAQRRAHGQITAPSTFKPPPRVTLTDTRRETWLKELANPSTSLRKLSRTIPHGIRGKQLLEHCWSKRIPTERAVWLAKCVGANEIRATKRKGASGTLAVGGEAKWIRDWTSIVEQYVEAAVSACAEEDWKERMSYAVRLTAHLYTEHLLDREHYMDWLSTSLETSNLGKLPIWILITQVYWKDLLKIRKHGRKLVAALCEHLHTAHNSPDRDLLEPLIDRISSLLQGLIRFSPENFVLPKTWIKHYDTLVACVAGEDKLVSELLSVVDQRNIEVSQSNCELKGSSRRDLVQLLDRSIVEPFNSKLARECWQLHISRDLRISTVLEWATSLYRPGLTKIYVGVRLLRNWSRSGVDVSEAVLSFLGSDEPSSCCSPKAIYHLVSELARSGHFSISRYFQWLIARGGIRGPSDLAEDAPCPGRLLAELPLNDLPDNIERLRKTMLGRADFSAEDEDAAFENEIAKLSAVLPSLPESDPMDLDIGPETDQRLSRSKLSRAIKAEMGLWLRSAIKSHTVAFTPGNSSDAWRTELAGVKCAITPEEFNTVREVLEDIEDISILADVLKIASTSAHLQVLGSIADTVSRHLETFAAIGALTDIFDILTSRLSEYSGVQHPDISLLLAPMAELAARIPEAETTAAQLFQELARRNSKTAAEACSPVSDEMAEALQTTEAEFSDEIEKVLASGNSMDSSTLRRLFSTIMVRLEASWAKNSAQQQKCGALLARLRSFDTKCFDDLLCQWLPAYLSRSHRPSLSQVLGPLVGQGCIGMATVLDQCLSALEMDGGNAQIATESIDMLLGPSGSVVAMTVEDAYRLDLKRAKLHRESPAKSITLICKSILRDNKWPTTITSSISTAIQSRQALAFLQMLVLTDLDAVNRCLIQPLTSGNNPQAQATISKVIQRLLDPNNQNPDISSQTTDNRIGHTMRLAGDLTLPYCQLELQMIFATDSQNPAEGDGDTPCSEAFESAIDSAVANDNRTWVGLVKMLDPQISRHLCERAERMFFTSLPANKSSAELSQSFAMNYDEASKALFTFEATMNGIPSSRAIQTAAQVIEKCNDLWQILNAGDLLTKNAVLERWLPLLISFIKTQSTTLDMSKSSSEMRTRILLSLSSLLLSAACFPSHAALTTTLFDLLLSLVDELPEEYRLQCIRTLKDKTLDPRISYAFGYSAGDMDWLQVNQKGKLMRYDLRRWEILSEPTPNVGENDTSLSLTLFQARKL